MVNKLHKTAAMECNVLSKEQRSTSAKSAVLGLKCTVHTYVVKIVNTMQY